MRNELFILAMMGLVVAFMFILLLMPVPARDFSAVCATVEFNPDITAEMRKKCREMRAQYPK